jgi:hypothetical protein
MFLHIKFYYLKGKKLVDSSWGNINIHIGLHIRSYYIHL